MIVPLTFVNELDKHKSPLDNQINKYQQILDPITIVFHTRPDFNVIETPMQHCLCRFHEKIPRPAENPINKSSLEISQLVII